jgi:hypothetical protein
MGFEYPKAKAMSGANAPENKIEKKLRNAKEILFKMFLFYLARLRCPRTRINTNHALTRASP